ncbi:TPA: Lrp/AsnC family transcriptional regulator [Candidatus Woesearchaeota archaeon]|nr:Lrp/AsnC family transcriptional regulator [Candidatus Woesearchaeota archaeon]HIH49037.1 Lrp/AsnC family transcriptional regulator [Candidatus Woesearchaeota archaeon]HIJ03040.1 Lrp/AsnC family transcriptional regulator [Candidatus Woesearchaeota archaeon]
MISKKDLRIIALLRENARISLTEISKATNIPISTIFDRLKQSRGSSITRFTTLLNFSHLGYMVRVSMTIKVDRGQKDAVQHFLSSNQSVNSVYKINNGYDFMIEGIFQQIRDVDVFTEELERRFAITDIKSYFIIDDIKKEAFLTAPVLES